MLTLYIKTGCPFCVRVLDKCDELGLDIEKKSIYDGGIIEELINIGGKNQVPFLIDSSSGIQMYESMDIIDYLEANYKKQKINKDSGNGIDNKTKPCM